jgi:hypothetical protein
MDHKSKNSHHGGTSVVQLNGTLGKLGFLVEAVPSKVNGAVTEITNEFVLAGNILHDTELKKSNEGEDLGKSGRGDGIGAEKGGKTVGVGVEGVAGVVNVSGKVDSGTGDDLSQEGKLADTAVLDLNVSKTVEALLVGTIEQAEGVEESKGSLGTKLVLEGREGGGGLANLGGGEGSGRAGKSSEGNNLHHGESMGVYSFMRLPLTRRDEVGEMKEKDRDRRGWLIVPVPMSS